MDTPKLQFDYYRRYGVELEVNATDGKDHLSPDKMPEGADLVAHVVSQAVEDRVIVKNWHEGTLHWDKSSDVWLVKPDGSCGMEICSPVSKGWKGLEAICKTVDALKKSKIQSDRRCSLHVHVEIADLSIEELASVVAYWIKCEPIFLDAFPDVRKNNRYCQFVGLWDWFQTDTRMTAEELVRFIGRQKYTSVNTLHFNKGKRQTIEFRIGDNGLCVNSYMAKNWIRLVIHFVEMARRLPMPGPYKFDDPWSSWLWLDADHVFELLGFDGKYDLSPGMKQIRNWFIARLVEHLGRSNLHILSLAGRRIAHTQVFDKARKYIESEGIQLRDAILPTNFHEAVYGKIYQV